jgi:hypothetical protein
MDMPKSPEFLTGLKNIERDIIAKLAERGVAMTSDDFKWSRGNVGTGAEIVAAEISVRGKSDRAVVSLEQAEGCQKGVLRIDVALMIGRLVKHLSE